MKKSATTYIILKCLNVIPRRSRRELFIKLFNIFYHLSPKHRFITIHNLKNAFPEKSTGDIIAIAKGVYKTLGIVAADFFDIPFLNKENISDLVDVDGMEHLEKALTKNKGVLLFGAHFGNWELAVIAISLLLKPVVVIYRPLDSPMLDNLVEFVRSSTGNTPVPKERAIRQMIRGLRKNDILGILIDQNVAWYEGVFVEFFGRTACTTNGLAALALYSEAPVIPGHIVRLQNGRYRLAFLEEMKVVRTGNDEEDIVTNTQNFTKVVEDVIRQYPDQWLWIHQRWKTKPWQVEKTRRMEESANG
ncbi:MAG TPA: lysophospholipid acyltransferase family protein [Syntrophales bacterium]|nr:lysophospholipid acyltransferase family protein [Syntrophales bacterium]